MKDRKYNIIFGLALICAVLFAACDNGVNSPSTRTPVESGYGRISISLTGEEEDVQQEESQARTVLPSAAFDKYVYTFTRAGESTGVEETPDSEGFFILEVGTYTVEVEGFMGAEEPYVIVASGVSGPFNVGPGNNAPVEVPLTRIAAGAQQGIFSYTITYPAGAGLGITLQKWPGLDDIILNPVDVSQGNGKTQTLLLDSGTYLLTIFVSKTGLYAGISEAVHVDPLLTTVYIKNYLDDDFLSKLPGIAVAAPTFSGATQNSITINPVDPPANGQDVEYGISTTDNANNVSWQTGLSFTGLNSGTRYYIFARSAEDGDYTAAGAASGSLQVIIVTNSSQWSTALSTTSGTAGNPRAYTIAVIENFTVSGTTGNSLGTAQYVVVTLKGSGTVSLSSNGSVIRIGNNQTFIIDDENLILQGRSGNNNSVINIQSGGTLELKNGIIRGNTSSTNGGGVNISGGSFSMSGGAISGNTATGSTINGGGMYISGGAFTMSGGIISGNVAGYRGGGVYVTTPGIFTMTGGTVYGSNEAAPLANTANGSTNGAALYVISGTAKYGDDVNILPHSDNQSLYTNYTIIPGSDAPNADYDITGTGTYLYGDTITVIITPKPGASPGAITIWYEGVSPTVYPKSNTVPVNAGTYLVTFDVVEAPGFPAQAGLRAGNIIINRANGGTVSAPTVNTVTHDSITVNPVPPPSNGQTVEYARNTTTTVPSTGWQDGTTFTGLTGSTSYYLFARAKENANYNAGTPAISASTTTTLHSFTVVQVGGSSANRTSTTSLTLNFSGNPGAISASNITVSGAALGGGAVTGSGNTRSIPVNLTLAQGVTSGIATVLISFAGVQTSAVNVTVYNYPPLTGTVNITGTPAVGNTLAANTSLGGSGTIYYQWVRNGTTNIGTDSTYTVQTADEEFSITVTVTRANNSGNITSPAVGPVPKTHNWNSSTPPTGVNDGHIVIIGVGASGTLVVPSGAAVTISDSGTGMVNNGPRAITLNISANARVNWTAMYQSTNNPVVSIINDGGVLDVVSGIIHNDSTGRAISTSSASTIIVSGGRVSGGPFGGAVINSTNASGTVTVSGGQVIANGDNTNRQTINAAGTLNITGGLVIAELPNAVGGQGSGVVNKTPDLLTNGTIIGYTLGGSHTVGSTSGLTFLPSGANVSWGLRDAWETGINYHSSSFYPLSGVSVNNRIVWDSSRVPSSASIATGSIIIIAEGASSTLTVPTGIATTIISQGTEAVDNGNRTITLSIGASALVTWRADYSGASSSSLTSGGFINVSSTGTLDIAEGNISYSNSNSNYIDRNSTIYTNSNSNIIVSGGVVSNTTNTAIYSTSTSGSAVTISDGVVSATSGRAIYSTGGTATVTVSGGVVSATSGTAINSTGTSSVVTVSGGVVSATTGTAINYTGAGSGIVTVSGGVVGATTGTAINYSNNSGNLNITGGLVIAQRGAVLGTGGVINRNNWNLLSGNGTIIGYTPGAYNAGTTTGLVFETYGGPVSWGSNNGQSALNHPAGVYAPVSGVSIGGVTTIISEDFEGTNSFTMVNGSLTNQWRVGTATSYGGARSAYISDNNGTSNAYTITSSSTVHMYRNVTFTSSSTPYILGFYWKAQGESSYDYMTVHLVEATVTPVAGTPLVASTRIGLERYNLSSGSGWNYASISIPASNSGTTKRLVFTWVNDASGGTQPPVAIDNILLTR
ncbi:MAG: hypothetical protein FWG99_06280 [Treponema sp.]|nr:hypothetical protein [Treponema sp.]